MSTASKASQLEQEWPPPLYTFGVPWPEFNDGLSYTDVIRPSQNATTLIDFYYSKYRSSAPLQGWLQRIRNGQITINGIVVADPQAALSPGSKIIYHRIPWKEARAPFMLQVLYEDDDMVAINKPSGLQVLPGGLFQQRTVLTQLQWKASKQGSICSTGHDVQQPHPVPVHRLGRGTSGILLCAKTKLAKTTLATYFAEGTSFVGENRMPGQGFGEARRISKFYRALVRGILEYDEILIEQPIGVVQYPGVAKGLYVASSSGKPALSKVQVLERDTQQNRTVVQVEIHSGRPHQIRIHLAFIGHPLVGDPLYQGGGQPNLLETETIEDSFAEDGGYQKPERPLPGDCGYYLHAHRLVLCHPSMDKMTEIIAPLPSILQTRQESNQIRAAEGMLTYEMAS
ncbi:RNA pseudouridine synthase 5 isoform X1 [Dendrobium catenatum]|uniref:RNA pseudouridine synthase 5 isoform X1 n=1 Tax=Dendrobium catenatum TaxID=906689 RepID=UPI0009F24F8B|nr:RNA pseudouridine synthase 5 isoform X1 [Dendrobium catenatum]